MGLKNYDPSQFFIGTVLHINCGKSRLGDVRTNQFSIKPGVLWADCHDLPFPDASFDTVMISQVPVNDRLVERQKWLDELARVARKRVVIAGDAVFRVPGFRFSFFYAATDRPKATIMTVYDREEGGAAL